LKQILSIFIVLILTAPFKNIFAQLPCSVTISASNNPICNGESIQLNASATGATNFIWSPSTGLSASTGFSVTASPLSNITYTATVSGGCTGSATIPITVNSNPTAAIIPIGNINLCSGNSVILTASGGNSYLWSTGATTNQITVSLGGTYFVTVTNSNSCTSSASKVVTIISNPIAVINPTGNINLCSGSSTTLTASGGNSYLWSTGATTNQITVSSGGNYFVTVTNSNGCTNSTSKVVTLVSNPIVSINPNGPTTFCSGVSLNLSATGANTYNWSPSTGLNQTTGSTVTASPTLASTYTYTVIGTNTFGCTSSSLIQLIVNAKPTVSINPNGPTTFCNGLSVDLVAAGSSGVTYLWSNSSTNSQITVASSGFYSVTVTNSNGCTNSTSQSVTVNSNPIVSINPSGPTTFCSGVSLNLSASGANTYNWSPSTGLNQTTGSTVTASPTLASTYTYTVIGTNTFGCTGSSSIQLIVNAKPTVAIIPNGPTTFCSGLSVDLAATGSSGVTYLWSNSSTNSQITVASSGFYSVTVTNSNGCTNSTSQSVTVNSNPIISINPSGPTTFCSGVSLNLSAAGANTYNWSPSTGLNQTTGSTVTANPTLATTYTYTVIGTNTFGCTGSSSIQLIVNANPTVAIIPNGPTTFCNGLSVELAATGSSGVTYLWSNSSTNSQITASSSGTYSVTVTNSNNCTDTNSQIVIVNPNPLAITGGNQTICFGDSISIGSSTISGNTYSWSSNPSGYSSNLSSPSVIPTVTTTYTLLETTSSTGCFSINAAVITVIQLPTVPITGSNSPVCLGQTLLLTASAQTGATFSWTGPNSFSSLIQNPSISNVSLAAAGNYFVNALYNGCSSPQESISIIINPLPDTSSIIGHETVCKNSSQELYSISQPVNTDYSYNWEISNGQIINSQSIPAIINWNNSSGFDTIKLTQINNITGCSNLMFLPVIISDDIAPFVATVIRKPNSNILVCSDSSFGIHYQWGYTIKSTFQEIFITGATLQYVLLPQPIDTSLYSYWVNTYYIYNTQSCETRSYYNQITGPLGYSENIFIPDILVYPNPSINHVNIYIQNLSIKNSHGILHLYNSFGQLLDEKLISNNSLYVFNLDDKPDGLYFIELLNNDLVIRKKIIKQ
jgi:hypothetical protein